MLPFAMVVGGVVAIVDRWHRRLGDLMADTLVVRDARQILPQALGSAKARVNSFQTDAALRGRILMRVTRHERDLIMDLALRRDQIDDAIREELFAGAAAHFRNRLALPADVEHLSDEQTVVNLALLIQDSKFTA
jgi:ParB-like chromosome segregation protein Spo0J